LGSIKWYDMIVWYSN